MAVSVEVVKERVVKGFGGRLRTSRCAVLPVRAGQWA